MSLRHQSSDCAGGWPSHAGCHHPDSFSLAVTARQKWHNDMFIEKLWIIEKVVVAVGMSQPLTKNKKKIKKKKNMDRKSLIVTRTRAGTRAPRENGEKNSQQCTGRDGNHSFYKAHLNMKIIDHLHV